MGAGRSVLSQKKMESSDESKASNETAMQRKTPEVKTTQGGEVFEATARKTVSHQLKTHQLHSVGKESESKKNLNDMKSEIDEDLSESIAAALRCGPEKSLERLAEIGKRSPSALLSTALKTSLSEVLRKSIEAKSAKDNELKGIKSPALCSKIDMPLVGARKVVDNINIPQPLVKSPCNLTEKTIHNLPVTQHELATATECCSQTNPSTFARSEYSVVTLQKVVNQDSVSPSVVTVHPLLVSTAKVLPSISEPSSSQVCGTKQVTQTSPETIMLGPGEKTAKQKKGKKRHFKGGTYGLYLTPARKKKKSSKKCDSSSKDDELSLASTENGSNVDSEDGSSMFSEDYNTPSEKSLADEEGCSNSRCSPIFMSSDQRPDLSESKESINCTRENDDNVEDDEPVLIFKVHDPNASGSGENSYSEETKIRISEINSIKELMLGEAVPVTEPAVDILSTAEPKYRQVDGEIMVTADIHVDENISVDTNLKNISSSALSRVSGSDVICSDQSIVVSRGVSHLPCEHNNTTKGIPLSTIATSVKSRQRMKRRFTDDIIDTDVGILSLNSMSSCRKVKGDLPLPPPPQTSDIVENFAVNSECEAKQKPVIKTEFVYNAKQTPVSSCTCADTCLELNVTTPSQYYCQAVDSIDNKFVGCCNPVASTRLVRSSVRHRYILLCEMHLWRMTHHHTCPRCGLFCSQGTFMRCGREHNGRQEFHFFHVQCELNAARNPDTCPHCGYGDGLEVVHLEVDMYSPDFHLRQNSIILQTNARISCPSPTRKDVESVILDADKTFTISGRVLCSFGLPEESNQTILDNFLVELNKEHIENIPLGSAADMYDAIDQCNVKKVLFLLAKGFNPDQKYEEHDGNTALHFAAAKGNIVIVHLLVQAGAVVDPMNKSLRTPLMLASENNRVDVVTYLVKKRIGVNTRGEAGMTCLHIAAREGFVNVCRAIMDSGKARIDAQDDGGWTPIVWAAEHGHAPVVKYLLDRGGNPEIRDNEGNTALHWAAFSGNVEVCTVCLDAGCDVNETNEHGDTPMHIAARQDHSECIDIFLLRDANTEIRNRALERAVDCCINGEQSKSRRAIFMSQAFRNMFKRHQHRAERIVFKDIALGRERYPIRCINGIDDAEISLKEFLYVTENCETCPINIDRCITSLQHCDCSGHCSASTCTCSAVSIRCWYDRDGHLVPEFNTVDPPLLFECNRACSCDISTCQNRVVQKGMTCRLELIRTEGRGWGVRALKDIPKGTFICEYVGELISDSEADTRQDDSYLFDLDNKDGETYCLDARHFGNISRFINHFCEPNLVPVKVFIDHQDLSFPRIAFFSVRDIGQYEELGFDYGEKFWIIKSKSFTCNCGSPKCKYSKEMIHKTLAKN